MKHSERVQLFNRIRAKYSVFLTSLLWKLSGDRELFTEAMQYTLLEIWQRVEKLRTDKAAGYIYRIALSANSRAWRNRVGRNGHVDPSVLAAEAAHHDAADRKETAGLVRRAIAELPPKQSQAIAMRYLQQHDYDTIADHLKCSRASARSHVSKAVAALKSRLTCLAERE